MNGVQPYPQLSNARVDSTRSCSQFHLLAAMASLACSSLSSSALRSSFQGDALVVDNAASSSSIQAPSKGTFRIEAKESRIGKAPIAVPKGVTINLDGQSLTVKGPLGELARTYPREVKLSTGSDGLISVERAVESRRARQMHGLFR